MSSKIKSLKYPKSPAALLKDGEVITYIFHLEDEMELDKLPKPILIYYVIGLRLLSEVDNGGFHQYLSSSSVKTLPYLYKCARLLGFAPLTQIVEDLLQGISNYLGTDDVDKIKAAGFEQGFESLLSSLDERIYELDEDVDILSLINRYYSENMPSGTFNIELFKEKESEHLRYFTSSVSSSTLSQSVEAFMDFVSELSHIDFEINLSRWDELLRITAIDRSATLDLNEIMEYFPDKRYSFGDKGYVSDRDAIPGLEFDGVLNGLYFTACNEERDVWRIAIEKSGFDENEYKMTYRLFSKYTPALHDGKDDVSTITLGDLPYDENTFEIMKDILVSKAAMQDNVYRVSTKTTQFNKYGMLTDEKILYEI